MVIEAQKHTGKWVHLNHLLFLQFHEHAAYLVDSLWGAAGSELRDWETMTGFLLQEAGEEQGKSKDSSVRDYTKSLNHNVYNSCFCCTNEVGCICSPVCSFFSCLSDLLLPLPLCRQVWCMRRRGLS